MEAFSFYYKRITNIDAYPLILDYNLVKSKDDFQNTIKAIMPAYSLVEFFGVDERKLTGLDTESTPFPVFHDDQHGTAVVVLAGIINP